MDSQKFQIILGSLLERSEKGELNWKTTGNSDKFLLPLNESSVTVEKFESFSGETTYIFYFRNEKGEIVEELRKKRETMSDEIFEKSEQLYDLARRKALNADETIDRIIEQLKPDSIAA